MDWKRALLICPEVWSGAALVLAGVSALLLGAHGVLAVALAPFGVGVISKRRRLSKAAQDARERAKVRVRRDDDDRRR